MCFASAVQLAQLHGKPLLELTALNLQAQALHALGQPQSALSTLVRGVRRLTDQVVPERIARVRSNIGQLHRELGNLAEALEELLKAQQLFEEHGVSGRPVAVNLINMGQLYQDLGRYPEAAEFLQRAHQEGLTSGDEHLTAVAMNNLANGDRATGALFVARERFEAALRQAEQLGMTDYIVDNLDGLGQTLADLGDYSRALEIHEQALEVARANGSSSGELDALVNLGRDYLHLNAAERAIEQLEAALPVATALQRQSVLFELHTLLSEAHAAAGDPWAALRNARQSQVHQEAVLAEQNRERLRELQVKHQLARVQQEADSYRLRSDLMRQLVAEAENRVRRRTEQLEQAHQDVIERLALAAEFRDDDTAEHTRRVGRNAAVIAYVLGFSEQEARQLYTAAKLHDVGKIGVPDAVLYKAGPLTEQELDLIRQHPELGARLLSGGQSQLLQLAEQICLHHHERYDGSGYPGQLAGEEIPLVARIVAAADVLDALTHERPYKDAWSTEAALQHIRSEAGRAFDPLVAEACLEAFNPADGVALTGTVRKWGDVRRSLATVQQLRRPAREPLFGPDQVSSEVQ